MHCGHPAFLAGFFGLGPTELVIIAIIVIVLFGSRLPKAARGLGQSIKEFKKGVREGSGDAPPADDSPRQIESRPVTPVDAPTQERQSHRD